MTSGKSSRNPKANAPTSKSTSDVSPPSEGQSNDAGESSIIAGILTGGSLGPATSMIAPDKPGDGPNNTESNKEPNNTSPNAHQPAPQQLAKDLAPTTDEVTSIPSPAESTRKSSSKSQQTTRSPIKSTSKTQNQPLTGSIPLGTTYVSALSSIPTGASQNPQPLSITESVNSNTSVDLSDAKAVWEMAMAMARSGKKEDTNVYFKIHAQIEATRKQVTDALVLAKRRLDEVQIQANVIDLSNPAIVL